MDAEEATVKESFWLPLHRRMSGCLLRLVVVCIVHIAVASAKSTTTFRLVVGEGGYARIMKAPTSQSQLTLAAWVNITAFPEGVAPILTAVAPDAKSQVAFFLRHDGVGLLWGGPPSVPRYHLDQVDRHPRTQWTPVGTNPQQRQKRDAVDYSGGLGDIVDILAESRQGRSYDTWTPYGFVDVDQMGVADLEASPSGPNPDLHILPMRDGFSRSESYNDWTNVPYELTMLESDPYEHHLTDLESRIITEPSGDDDFVFFNWNVPAPPKQSIPQSPNEWSPIWQPKKVAQVKESPRVENKESTLPIKALNSGDSSTSNNGRWSAQVTEVKLNSNSWIPHHGTDQTFTIRPQQNQQPPRSSTRPITSSQWSVIKSTIKPPLSLTPHLRTPRPTTQRPTTSRPIIRHPTPPRPTTRHPKTPRPTTRRPTTPRPTTRRPTTPRPTTRRPTTPRPTTRRPTTPRPTTRRPTTPRPTTRRPTTPRATTQHPITHRHMNERPPTTPRPSPQRTKSHTTLQTLPKAPEPKTTTVQATPTTRKPHQTKSPFNYMRFTTRRFTAPPTTSVPRDPTRAPSITRSSTLTSRKAARIPLWKRIKNPDITQHPPVTSSPTTTRITTSKTTAKPKIHTTPQTTTSKTTTTPITIPSTTTTPPTTSKTTTHTTRTTTLKPTTGQLTPVPTVRSTLQQHATEKPQITGQKSKVSIWSSITENHKPSKSHLYQDKWSGKTQGVLNAVNKHKSVKITPQHVDEFHRAMEAVPLVKDGNTAVVYSIPISDVEAFNAMYQHYQVQEAQATSASNYAPVVHDAVVTTQEEEINENRLGGSSLPPQDYDYPIQYVTQPETTNFKETDPPAVLREEEAVLIPTDEPLPPTPSRSDIPIEKDATDLSKNYEKSTVTKAEVPQTTFIPIKSEPVTEKAIQKATRTTTTVKQPDVPQTTSTPTKYQPVTQGTTQQDSQPSVTGVAENNFNNVQNQPLSPLTVHGTTNFNLPSLQKSPILENSKTVPNRASQRNDHQQAAPINISNTVSSMTESINLPSINQDNQVPLAPKSTNHLITSSANLPPSVNTPSGIQTVSTQRVPVPDSALPKFTHPPRVPTKSKFSTEPEPNVGTNEDTNFTEAPEHQSSSFAVFHMDDAGNLYYPAEGEEGIDELFSPEELYQPAGVLLSQEEAHPVSHYQEPSHLYHEQLPPQYTSSKDAPRPIAYSSSAQQSALRHKDHEDTDDVIFSADPQKLIEQGFLPRPVHYVSTQEEAQKWMQEQYSSQQQIEDRVFTVESGETHNTMPPATEKEIQKAKSNFHFKMVPYAFKTNQWYHLAFTWNTRDHQVGVYINGELTGTLTNVLPNQEDLIGGGLTIIGQTLLPDLTDFDPTSQFTGELSEVNMWGRRLGSESIRTIYQCGKLQESPALNWHQLSLRFYSDISIKPVNELCGA